MDAGDTGDELHSVKDAFVVGYHQPSVRSSGFFPESESFLYPRRRVVCEIHGCKTESGVPCPQPRCGECRRRMGRVGLGQDFGDEMGQRLASPG